MNWMWRFDETVAITLDTFRTMLTLMTEYPAFTFSQSQASVYRIVEEHDPEMLKEIRKRVKEGRWEVTASTWVEADKNMPSGESLARHALYAKRYLARLLDIAAGVAPAGLRARHLRPQPERARDPFARGRALVLPLPRLRRARPVPMAGALGRAGDRLPGPLLVQRRGRALHCRDGPGFLQENRDLGSMLRVYGVGDHGGGPTRRDIERIIDMDSWPVFPRIRFATFREFFQLVEKAADKLPVVNRELNPVFTGCYTTQARIKAANRMAENRLVEAETFSSIASVVTSSPYRTAHFARAWEAALFNHFHDIIPGSGTVDTREYALGQFQKIMAAASTEESLRAAPHRLARGHFRARRSEGGRPRNDLGGRRRRLRGVRLPARPWWRGDAAGRGSFTSSIPSLGPGPGWWRR